MPAFVCSDDMALTMCRFCISDCAIPRREGLPTRSRFGERKDGERASEDLVPLYGAVYPGEGVRIFSDLGYGLRQMLNLTEMGVS